MQREFCKGRDCASPRRFLLVGGVSLSPEDLASSALGLSDLGTQADQRFSGISRSHNLTLTGIQQEVRIDFGISEGEGEKTVKFSSGDKRKAEEIMELDRPFIFAITVLYVILQ